MVPDPRQTVKEASARSWDWVRKNTFNPVPFYRRSWEILRQDKSVFLWKLIADFISRAGTLAVVTFVISLIVVDLQGFLDGGRGYIDWLVRMGEIGRSPAFIAGFVGVAGLTTLLGTAIQAFVVSGIWGMIAAGLRGEPIEAGRTFASQTFVHFPHVLGLFFLKLAIHGVTGLIGLAIAVAFLRAALFGSFTSLSLFTQTFLLAGTLAFFIGWFALTRLTLEAIGAPLTIDELPLGEAILEGSAFVLENFWAMYRLLIFSLGLLLVPLFFYWILLMGQNALLLTPGLGLVAPLFRLAADFLLWFSLSVLGVLFYGAIFAFYRKDDQAVAEDRAEEKRRRKAAKKSRDQQQVRERAEEDHLPRSPELATADFLPKKHPYIFDLGAILKDKK